MTHISAVIQSLLAECGRSDITVYSYRDDFARLWCLGHPATDPVHLADRVVIVWDGGGVPIRGPVDLNRYLTPLDWAVAASLRQGSGSGWRVSIINTRRGRAADVPAVKFFRHFGSAVPWIRLFEMHEPCLSDLLAYMLAPATEAWSANAPERFELLAHAWAAALLRGERAGDHHALANILAPLIMLGGKGGPGARALQCMMHWIGLLDGLDPLSPSLFGGLRWEREGAAPEPETQSMSPEYKVKRLAHLRKKSLHAVLVDDCALSQDWGKILCRGLDVPFQLDATEIRGCWSLGQRQDPEINVYAFESAGEFWRALGEDLGEKTDRRFKLNVSGLACDVLFLDLRLFHSGQTWEEAMFYDALLPLAKCFRVEPGFRQTPHEGRRLPWRGFSTSELKAVCLWVVSQNAEARNAPKLLVELGGDRQTPPKDEARQQGETPNHIQSLTLLPRLLALLDPSLPIVLFSSTGRRDIIETLKPYGNVITDFEKPRMDGTLNDALLNEAGEKFRVAVDKALDLIETRHHLAQMMDAGPDERLTVGNQPIRHIEIYLDESGVVEEDNFRVGGLMVGYPDSRETPMAVDIAIRSGGPVFYQSGSALASLNKYLSQDEVQHEVADKIAAYLGKYQCVALPLVLYRPRRSQRTTHPIELADPESIDNTLLELVSHLIEVALFQIAPRLCRQQPCSVNVYLATRLRFFAGLERPNQFWQEMFRRWGIVGRVYETPEAQRKFKYLIARNNGDRLLDLREDEEAGYRSIWTEMGTAMVSQAMSRWPADAVKFRIECAVAVALTTQGKPAEYPYFRHMHYVIDQIVRQAPRDLEAIYTGKALEIELFGRDWPPVKGIEDLLVVEVCDEGFRLLLDAARRQASGDLLGALLRVIRTPDSRPSRYRELVTRSLQPALADLQGEDLLALARLNRELSCNAGSPCLLPPPPAEGPTLQNDTEYWALVSEVLPGQPPRVEIMAGSWVLAGCVWTSRGNQPRPFHPGNLIKIRFQFDARGRARRDQGKYVVVPAKKPRK